MAILPALESAKRLSAPARISRGICGAFGNAAYPTFEPMRATARAQHIAKMSLGSYLQGMMNRQEILAKLRENETALRARGVTHAALFGSRARSDNRPDSDIDIMVEFDPAAHVTVFNYAGLKDYMPVCSTARLMQSIATG